MGHTTPKDKPDDVFFAYDPNGDYKKGDGQYFDDQKKAYNFTKQTVDANEKSGESGKSNIPKSENVSREADTEGIVTTQQSGSEARDEALIEKTIQETMQTYNVDREKAQAILANPL